VTNQQKMRMAVLLAALALCWVATSPLARGQDRTLWQIGKFDQSSEEFGLSFGFGSLTSIGPDPVYRVGQSNWKTDWSGFQPGSANGMAGGREHPFTVFFPLDQRPRGIYTLTVAVLPYMPRRPNLRIEINGKRGMLYLRPRLSYDMGNFPVAFIPQYSYQRLRIEIPTPYFKQGQNKLVLTCIDDPGKAENSSGTVGIGDSGIFYDALKLSQDPEQKFSAAGTEATTTPTVFYKEHSDKFFEVIESTIRINRKIRTGSVQLEMNGHRYSHRLSTKPDFGEQLIDFEIPEWTGEAKGIIKVKAGTTHKFSFAISPARKWTIDVVPHTHLDVGYTDYQGKVAEVQARVLEQAAQLIREHPSFRFSMDASWDMQQLLETRSKSKQDEIVDLIRQGKIAVPAQYCNLLTGYASLETLYRSLYFTKSLSRKLGIPFDYANITDVPSYTGSYPTILASAGIKYWAAAGNNWRAPFMLYGRWNEKSPFWWQGPDGQKVLFWYSRHYMQVQSLFGLPPSLAAVRDSLPVFLQAYEHPDYKPDTVLIYGTQVENTDLFPSTATFVQAWNREYAYPKLRYTTFHDFFTYIDTHYGKDLPTYRGDGGPYWEDGIGSDAFYAAMDRENQNRALSADLLSSLTHTLDPDVHAPRELEEDIWRNIVLFAEHTWASANSITQPDHVETIRQLEVKDSRATTARLEINNLMNRSLSQLADSIHVPANTLVVFNPLNWTRDALVETDLSEHAVLKDLTTDENVALDVLWAKEGFLHVRFMARKLPSVGYKCYAISYPASAAAIPREPQIGNRTTIENNYYRVTVDHSSGAASSIFDKQLDREIVDTRSPYKFDQYVYVSGGDGNTRIMRPISTWPEARLTEHPASQGELVSVTKTPFGQSIRLRSRSMNTPEIDTEILLFDDSKKIEFINHVKKVSVTTREGVYFAFPVRSTARQFAYSTQDEWIDPGRDLLKGASLEWFNIQGWMASRDGNFTVGVVPLDAPLASFGDINRGTWPSTFSPKSSTLFSYVMNNYWDTNYRAAQGGDFTFRYVVTDSAEFSPLQLTRLAEETMRPVEIDEVVGQDKVGNPGRPLPAQGASFLQIDKPNVVLVDWKAAEDGNGTIVRLQEIAGRATTASLRFNRLHVTSAMLCNAVEDNKHPVPLQSDSLAISLRPHEVATIRVR